MKNIVITGASKGIGRAIALKFAAEGYSVAVCARNKMDLETLEREVFAIKPSTVAPLPHIFMPCDMRCLRNFAPWLQTHTFAEL